MIADLKPFPAMKDSGVPWLGEVPEHWEVKRLKRAAGLNPSKIEVRHSLAPDTPVTFLPMERVGADGRTDVRETPPASLVWNGFTYFRRGDVLVAKITPCFENGKGACLSDLPTEVGFGSTEFHVVRASHSVSPQFLYRLTTLAEFRRLGADAMTGAAGQQRVPQSFVANFPVTIPPLPEQAAIVRFLDHADRRIRRYIRAKQKLIKLLEEQKQAIIHRAVTRGLDTNVRLKPSGVAWLGDVPEHWEVSPLKRLLSRVDYGTSEVAKPDGKIRVLTMGNIQNGEVVIAGSGGLYEVPHGLLLEEHDLLFTRTNGNPELVGKVGLFRGLATDQVTFASYLVRLRVREPFNPHWLHLLLNSSRFWAFARSHALVNLQTNLNSTRYGQFLVPVPPPAEQGEIVGWIEGEAGRSVAAAAVAQREISLLREYRTRLIADVVTGKLDVREAEARLPDEAEEPEPRGYASVPADPEEADAADLDAVPEGVET